MKAASTRKLYSNKGKKKKSSSSRAVGNPYNSSRRVKGFPALGQMHPLWARGLMNKAQATFQPHLPFKSHSGKGRARCDGTSLEAAWGCGSEQ